MKFLPNALIFIPLIIFFIISGRAQNSFNENSFSLKPNVPENEIIIEGPSIIKIGLKNNSPYYSDKYGAITLYAKSNHPDIPISWSIKTERAGLSERLWFMKPFEKDNAGYRENYSGIDLVAKENFDLELIEEKGQIIETEIIIEAKQLIDGNEVTAQKQIEIHNPRYYYVPYPDCSRLFELDLISSEEYKNCDDQLENCKIELWDNGDHILENDPKLISAILDAYILSNSELVDENQKLNSTQINFVRKISKEDGSAYPPEEAGQFRDFVKPAPCMAKWFGLEDRETIISLAHEAMDKIEAINDKIEALQAVINTENYMKIGTDIKKLKESIEPIRKEYGDKINKIAEKGTIQIETIKSDPAQYYQVNGVKVVEAHWENRWLDILVEVDLVKNPIPKTVNEKQLYKTIGDIRFKYFDKEGENISKGTAMFIKFAMPFGQFEKLDLIDFYSSQEVLRMNVSKEGFDTFGK